MLENLIVKIENLVWSLPLVLLLIGTHIYFTIKLKFPQKYIFKGLKWIFTEDKKNNKDGISSFKSLMSVLAATLGTGNIIGVAASILIGGVGSIFWIFFSGVFAIATKYAETYIVLKYRKKDKKHLFGGAMYVLKERIGSNKMAVLFSIFLIFTTLGMGSMIQANAISTTILQNFNINKYVVAILIALPCLYVLLGNEKRISNISSILIPIATVIYLISCVFLLIIFRKNIIPSVSLIIKEAFTFKAAAGGIFSSLAIRAMSSGLSKGLFTNEAGMGTSPIFDSSVREKNIVKQSIISSTTVFIDTVVLCTITGIIFVASTLYLEAFDAASFAQAVFLKIPFGKYIYIFVITIFAISTIPCSGYYGKTAIHFLFKGKEIYQGIYMIIYMICVFIGSISSLKIVWSLSSIANAFMIIPNLYMLFYLRKEIQ